jgi:hypothetical protein
MARFWAVLALAAAAAAPTPRSAETAAAVEETMHAYGEASERDDAANLELMSALSAASAAELELAGARVAAGLTTVTQAFSADDPAPPPPPWYVSGRERGADAPAEKAAEVTSRSAATKEAVAKTASASAEANARRDEANLALMQATNNAFNLNSVALTQRIGASMSWAGNAATPDDPAPPPPPVPAAPGYVLGSEAAPLEKALSVEDASVQDEAASEWSLGAPLAIVPVDTATFSRAVPRHPPTPFSPPNAHVLSAQLPTVYSLRPGFKRARPRPLNSPSCLLTVHPSPLPRPAPRHGRPARLREQLARRRQELGHRGTRGAAGSQRRLRVIAAAAALPTGQVWVERAERSGVW